MEVEQIALGLWRWTAPHPEWTPGQGGPEGWERDVASFYCEIEGDLLLIDPIVPADDGELERFWRALDRDVEKVGAPHVVLTCAWHVRSSAAVVERYGGSRLWAHADGLDGLPDNVIATDPFQPGDDLPGGAAAIPAGVGGSAPEVLLWLPSHAALVSGDVLLGAGPGAVRVCPDSWLGGADPAAVRAGLRMHLEELPIERVLVTHGEPVLEEAREALDRALG